MNTCRQIGANELIAAAPKGTDVRLYKSGHEFNANATRERLEWLRTQLRLR
jgi:hypothetical protein